MYLPSIFEDNFVDNFFHDMFSFPFEVKSLKRSSMNTDIKDLGDRYEMAIELPGYEKKDIQASLNQGYLNITANRTEEKNQKDEDGKYLRKERFVGKCQRSYYVGEHVTEADIQASFDNGILKLVFPKLEEQAKIQQNRYIPIE